MRHKSEDRRQLILAARDIGGMPQRWRGAMLAEYLRQSAGMRIDLGCRKSVGKHEAQVRAQILAAQVSIAHEQREALP